MCETYAASKYAHLQHTFEKADETLETNAYNIRLQPLQHVQHRGLFLQHPYETLTTYI